MSAGGAIKQGDNNTFMPDIWGYLLVKYDIKSVLDIGCGYGHALKWFSDVGRCNIKGVDGDPDCINNPVEGLTGIISFHDFRGGPINLGVPFDLAWSSEFLEHVEAQYIPNFMPAFRSARYAVVTHGEPNQAGTNHVNCQDSKYWIGQFHNYGFEYNPVETHRFRRMDRWHATWGRRTLMFFERV